jgi:mono/diheme cytochrome c family protein
MKKFVLVGSLLLFSVAICGAQRATPPRYAPAQIQRGKYLTRSVAMCVQCHSPRDEEFNVIEARIFEGAPVPVSVPVQMQYANWAGEAPNIRGLITYTDDQAIRLLTTGIARNGAPPRPPMPPFRLTREDADAVVAYLRSLAK